MKLGEADKMLLKYWVFIVIPMIATLALIMWIGER